MVRRAYQGKGKGKQLGHQHKEGTEMAGTIDEARLGEFMGQMAGYMTGGALCFAIWLGDELGLYRTLAGAGPQTAGALSDATSCNPRLVREWLDGQVAGGLVSYDQATDTYELSAEAAAALADDSSPVFVARGMNALASLFLDHDKIAERSAAAAASPGVSTTRACSPGPSGSSAPATGPTCPPSGCPRWMGWTPSFVRVPR